VKICTPDCVLPNDENHCFHLGEHTLHKQD
jgi:hypothetical protein